MADPFPKNADDRAGLILNYILADNAKHIIASQIREAEAASFERGAEAAAATGDLTVCWDSDPIYGTKDSTGRSGDVVFNSTDGSHAVRLLYHAFAIVKVYGDKCLLDELEARGFDLATLRFSIERKK